MYEVHGPLQPRCRPDAHQDRGREGVGPHTEGERGPTYQGQGEHTYQGGERVRTYIPVGGWAYILKGRVWAYTP